MRSALVIQAILEMEPGSVSLLADWESFAVIVGSSAAVLLGLQFVVMTLVAATENRRSSRDIDAWGTPTVVHFCAVLAVAAILSAPWSRLASVGAALGTCGLVGEVYAFITIRRALGPTDYRPAAEDWIWHGVLPAVGYALVLAGSVLLVRVPEPALFVVGGAALLLLFTGVHNAWDTVTYVAIGQFEEARGREQAKGRSSDSKGESSESIAGRG